MHAGITDGTYSKANAAVSAMAEREILGL